MSFSLENQQNYFEFMALKLGGRGCLGEGRLGVPGQVWEFRFLPKKCLGKRLEVPDILLPDIRGLLIKGSLEAFFFLGNEKCARTF